MARQHYLVFKNPEPAAVNFALAVGVGENPIFKVMCSGATKKVWAQEAIRLAIASDLSANVTISDAPPHSILADVDSVPDGYSLLVVCPEGLTGAGRWAVLTLASNGEFRQTQVEVNAGVPLFLGRLVNDVTEGPLIRDVIWIRPDMRAEDLLPSSRKVA